MANQPDIFYIETSLTAGLTISEYRGSRPPRPTLWKRFKELAGGAAMTAESAR